MQKKRGQFSLEIIHCDGFTSLPATAQALYLQILSVCDDEGFTSQLGICKFLSHATDDDVKALEGREFIYLVGERKVCVVKHWRMNTYIHDGKVDPSTFAERALVFVNPNGNYTLDSTKGSPLKPIENQCIQDKKRNKSGISPETFRNTPASRDLPARGSHTNTLHTNTLHTNTLHTNTLHTNTTTPMREEDETIITDDCDENELF